MIKILTTISLWHFSFIGTRKKIQLLATQLHPGLLQYFDFIREHMAFAWKDTIKFCSQWKIGNSDCQWDDHKVHVKHWWSVWYSKATMAAQSHFRRQRTEFKDSEVVQHVPKRWAALGTLFSFVTLPDNIFKFPEMENKIWYQHNEIIIT